MVMRYDVYKDLSWLHNHLAFAGQHGEKILTAHQQRRIIISEKGWAYSDKKVPYLGFLSRNLT